MPFEIIRNDITKVTADAVVNTANPAPVVGAGTDAAIHKAAGPKLLEARKKIGEIPVGSCRSTRAYNLPAKYVLHTVSPAWQDGSHDELPLLRKAYDAALAEAASLHCRSVAFPLMAAGSYGFPMDQALSVAIGAFTDFLLTHEMQITLVIFNGRAFSLASSLFSDLKSYIDENYVREQTEKEYAFPRPERREAGAAQRPQQNRPLYVSEERKAAFACQEPALPEASCSAPMSAAKPAAAKTKKKAAAPPSRPQTVSSHASLDDFLNQLTEQSFADCLISLIDEKGLKDSAVYHKAQVSRQLFNKIINVKNYQPSKSTAIQLALALELDLAQTQTLLDRAGYALTRSSKADLVVQYYIERKEYSIPQINIALFDCGLPPLKTGSVA
ncbi:MAG: macro domain-containing protein [Lachnospiraceae bacterium]|nr:macro domain-containing protein [Lachnospiraceae bacterium]